MYIKHATRTAYTKAAPPAGVPRTLEICAYNAHFLSSLGWDSIPALRREVLRRLYTTLPILCTIRLQFFANQYWHVCLHGDAVGNRPMDSGRFRLCIPYIVLHGNTQAYLVVM